MAIGLLGRKVGMTQIYIEETGQAVPVTVIQAGPCHVLQMRSQDKDGYEAVQLGYLDKPRRLATRSQRGHVAKLDSKRARKRATAGVEAVAKPGCEPKRLVREFRGSTEGVSVGDEIGVDAFADISAVDVVGTSKGRGFAGVIKRYGFHRGPMTHGSRNVRRPGSIGCSAWPAKVVKGKKMPGQYGNDRKTIRNLEIVDIRPDDNVILLKGAVPGAESGLMAVNKPKFKQN